MSLQLNILIIGGYGEFGGRLAELLLQDGHRVLIAGRSLNKAQAFCDRHGGEAVELDRQGDLATFTTLAPDVVIDASGPYQHYGSVENRYRVVKAALEANAHYLDLSDDGSFTRDITSMHALAVTQNKFALSGVSSTPALSSSAVSALSSAMSSIEKIETSILPGAKAPQGASVMQAILNQVGNPIRFWRNGAWWQQSGWSQSVVKEVHTSVHRRASLISTADAELFPAFFNANSVLFRAGLAMPIMQRSLECIAWLREKKLLPNPVKLLKPLRFLASVITPLGNDRGGMLVEVVGHVGNPGQTDSLAKHQWTLLAEPGQGPYIPGVAARAILRQVNDIAAGARPCLNELPLSAMVDAMDDLGVSCHSEHKAYHHLFQSQLGKNWQQLPMLIQQTHSYVDIKTLSGMATVKRGNGRIAKLIAAVFRFPPESNETPVSVIKTRLGNSEVWVRDFSGRRFQSTLSVSNRSGFVTERFGWLTFTLKLPVIDNALHFEVVSGSCLGIPIPTLFLPKSNTREFVQDGKMHFSVELVAPFNFGLLVHYQGWLQENDNTL